MTQITKQRKLNREPASKKAPSTSPSPSPEPEQSTEQTEQEIAEEEPAKSFKELGVIEQLCDACTELGYKAPTKIQAQAIPIALQGRDLIGLAETGSGKTAAFVLPILQNLMETPQSLHSLILAPTRELAQQISQVVEALGSLISVRCTLLIGGVDMVSQSIALGKKPHVIVATPGRLLDHMENTKGFSLRQLKFLVLDEADRLLDMDFGPLLDKILKILPKQNRKTYLFSATMSSKVESLQRASLVNPVRLSISSKYQTVSTLIQRYVFLPHKYKDIYLVYLLNEWAGQTGVIFTRTIHETQRVTLMLRNLGYGSIPIHGQLSQSSRMASITKFKAKARNLLIATDVAARGLDIPSVDFVLNYDLPSDSQSYIHRVGRTARAGRSGIAISFVTQYDIETWMRTEKALNKKLDEHKIAKDEAMVFAERVGEAQRSAAIEMRDMDEKGRGSKFRHKGGKRTRDGMDEDQG
ncbi:RNA-dependent ATPase RRP3 [Aspergillus affinis]|uniref:RNA-dependent ATPase RRP3 n=1 Tax=Aspergillus affinis TaxID=1070780 RepID=UPI0022FE75DB|nr:ATP-dependent rRNA helicase rrp3 [Aspergillus affinis]KAI9039193.1 ATP-dependent rRNA helicase rrp3 [Aspergillus affinis]